MRKFQIFHANLLRYIVEMQAYGFCSKLGEVTRVSSGAIRLYFTYLTFMTFGSPIIIYLSAAFLVDMKKHFRRKRSPILDF